MTPQWRLSLKDLGQSGNGTVPRHNNARRNLRGRDKTLVPRSWEQLIKQQRRGDGNAFATEMRQQRIHTAEKKRNELPDEKPARFLFRSEAAKVCVRRRRAYVRVVTMEQ